MVMHVRYPLLSEGADHGKSTFIMHAITIEDETLPS